MKKFVFLLLFSPLILSAQTSIPKFENDTLYTTSGYKIYKGQVLYLASGTAENGKKFRFIKLENGGLHLINSLYSNTTIMVKKLYDFKMTDLGNRYIGIYGTITYKDGSKSKIGIDINFDRAIDNFEGLSSELIVPEEFKNKKKDDSISEMERLFKLYKDGALTKEEFEALKKKLIEKN